MAIEYASKFTSYVDEAFSKESITESIINHNFDWLGVEAIKVWSVPTVALNDYTLTGTNRYGTPEELDNSVQALKVEQDKAFTFTIDKKSEQDTMGVMNAAAALGREIRDVIIPTVDKYRIAKIVAGAKNTIAQAVTKANAYETVLSAQEKLTDELAPTGGRIMFASAAFYNLLKLDSSFIHASDIAQDMLIRGQVGTIDGLKVVAVPKAYLPEGVNFFITNPIATPSPTKLAEYKIHDNAPGISGYLVEGRIRYDAFVLNNKKGAIVVNKNA